MILDPLLSVGLFLGFVAGVVVVMLVDYIAQRAARHLPPKREGRA